MSLDGKICKKCNKFKPFSDFYQHKNNRDGFHTKCKPCSLIELRRTSGFQHNNQKEIEIAKELLEKLGYDLSKPIHPQFMERFTSYYNGQEQ